MSFQHFLSRTVHRIYPLLIICFPLGFHDSLLLCSSPCVCKLFLMSGMNADRHYFLWVCNKSLFLFYFVSFTRIRIENNNPFVRSCPERNFCLFYSFTYFVKTLFGLSNQPRKYFFSNNIFNIFCQDTCSFQKTIPSLVTNFAVAWIFHYLPVSRRKPYLLARSLLLLTCQPDTQLCFFGNGGTDTYVQNR